MVFLGSFGPSPDYTKDYSEVRSLQELKEGTRFTELEIIERIFHYFYGNGDLFGMNTIYDNDVMDLDLGGNAANSATVAEERRKELLEVSARLTIGPKGAIRKGIPLWFAQFLKKDAPEHIRLYREEQEKVRQGKL